MAGEWIALKHPVKGGIDFLGNNFPGHERAVREVGREQCLPHAANGAGAQHRRDAGHDHVNFNASRGCNLRERFAHKTFDFVFEIVRPR